MDKHTQDETAFRDTIARGELRNPVIQPAPRKDNDSPLTVPVVALAIVAALVVYALRSFGLI